MTTFSWIVLTVIAFIAGACIAELYTKWWYGIYPFGPFSERDSN